MKKIVHVYAYLFLLSFSFLESTESSSYSEFCDEILFDSLQNCEKNSYDEYQFSNSFSNDPIDQNQYPHITSDEWLLVNPYLLPENHPLKSKLDAIFKRARVTHDSMTFTEAGFQVIQSGPFNNLIVAKHPNFKNFIFKVFFDEQEGHKSLKQLVTRAYGAVSLQEAILRFGHESLFKVPRKWIYPMPQDPSPPSQVVRQNFILIVEEMDIYRDATNRALWKSRYVNEKLLNALYDLLKDQGLADSIRYFNIPFCRDGKVAFIDTEYNHSYPVHLDFLAEYLGPEAREIWISILNRRGAVAFGR